MAGLKPVRLGDFRWRTCPLEALMAYSKCPVCGRAVAKVRVVSIDPDPFMFGLEDLRGPIRLAFLCPHDGCGADLLSRTADVVGSHRAGRGRDDSVVE